MRKDNKGQQKTIESEMFPQSLPHGKNGGETMTRNKCCDLGRITNVTQYESEFGSQKDYDSNPDGSKYVHRYMRYGSGSVGKQGKHSLLTHKTNI